INSSEGYESQLKQAEYVAGHSANAYQNSSTGKKVLIWTYFSVLLLAFTCIPFFIFFKVYLGAYISGGVFVGTILISVIIKLAAERAGRRAHLRHPDKVVKAQGVVKACILSSMSSTGGGSYRSSVRITGITYRVIVVVDGREYEGYTSRCFNEGEIITVMIDAKGKSKRAHIV
ncbi:MAG: hypothetical protein K2J61_04200, partial [Clostridia bacterium]|nr:hypothetical protein [Clostridia bacterium]